MTWGFLAEAFLPLSLLREPLSPCDPALGGHIQAHTASINTACIKVSLIGKPAP